MKKIIVSACLLGTPCRYDGRSKPNSKVLALNEKYELIPICPEVMGGLPTPRIPCEIVNDKVLRQDGADVSQSYIKGAEEALKIATQNGCKIALLKARSPSCGKGKIYDGTFSRTLKNGNGICADLFIKNNITVIDENEIYKLEKI